VRPCCSLLKAQVRKSLAHWGGAPSLRMLPAVKKTGVLSFADIAIFRLPPVPGPAVCEPLGDVEADDGRARLHAGCDVAMPLSEIGLVRHVFRHVVPTVFPHDQVEIVKRWRRRPWDTR